MDLENNEDCCSIEEKINSNDSSHANHDEEEHSHDNANKNWKEYYPAFFSLIILLSGLIIEHLLKSPFFEGWIKIVWYVAAYLPVGLPVLKHAFISLKKGEVFTEFFLMSIATIGAMAIGEYPEGVAVMLFYAIGELFQSAAVSRAKNNIKALLDVRPKIANVYRDGKYQEINPETVEIDEVIQIKVGEKVPLDSTLISEKASVNTSALTGESKPQTLIKGEKILAGSINLEGVIEAKVTKLYNDSSISRILELVQNATSRKSKTELLIRKLAKIYTPIVVYLAIGICFIPYFFVEEYIFSEWLYRALIFLVISCPCALVISIPLGYFGGLGAASKNGILFKGATFLDQLSKVNTLVMDKTGTVTKGVFKIKAIKIFNSISEVDFMKQLMAIESKSTHPIAKAIMEYDKDSPLLEVSDIKEIAGKGLTGTIKGKIIAVGNGKLMEQFNISTPSEINDIVESIVLVSIGGDFAGYVTIADELKEDAMQSIRQLRSVGIKELIMLSGDKDSITQEVAKELNIDYAKGGLLPEDKLNEVENLKKDEFKIVAFVGDGINDAPVIAASDVGIAMGGLGSDVAIETADVIIQTDQPSKIATGINIGRTTQKIIWQNIFLAFGVKIIVLILGAGGLATMWEAVFADVGVALLAILNAIRLQRMKW
ncbi:MAG: heavy metal translocating P-type ATPase [Flavobacteriales bacterium]|jgi:Cd2+/Zn2+-exporting ATPase|nr:heavy metal translocating P-type ATPase [Flavobacteriales bacterium]